MRWLLLIIALVYVLFPRDMVPDYLAGWGWLDDLLVLYVTWRYYRRQSTARRTGEQTGQHRTADDAGQSRADDAERHDRRDPYAVLEITPDATREEIKAAYRRLAAKYHPDKVQHLGKEFQQLAEDRFKAIQQAYDALISR